MKSELVGWRCVVLVAAALLIPMPRAGAATNGNGTRLRSLTTQNISVKRAWQRGRTRALITAGPVKAKRSRNRSNAKVTIGTFAIVKTQQGRMRRVNFQTY